jgi:hypothetical protein
MAAKQMAHQRIMNATIHDYAAIADRIRGLESHLSSKIRGQQHAISRVCSLLERGQFGLNPIEKPVGSFLFLGPTGVGKTGLTLEFARYLFGDDHVFRFDMSEFLHLDSVKLFTGDKSGRIGRLGEALSKHHEGVLLFDEIERLIARFGISFSKCWMQLASPSQTIVPTIFPGSISFAPATSVHSNFFARPGCHSPHSNER